MTYEEIIESLPEDLRDFCGGDHKLTEDLYKKGYFKLSIFKVGDRVKRTYENSPIYTVVEIHPINNRDFKISKNSSWLVPWINEWEKV